MDEMGIDFSGYQDHSFNGGKDVLTLAYESLIPPLIKAIQELNERIKQLESDNT
jgi:trimeric autotransporter adhesin